MAGPFPGMDPYLEFQAAWPDFYNGLIAEIRNELGERLPGPSETAYRQYQSRFASPTRTF